MVQLKAGINSLHCVPTFTYSGPGYTAGKIRCIIGHKVLGVWVEDFTLGDVPFSVPSQPNPLTFTAVAQDIPIPASAASGIYSFYAKMIAIPSSDLYYQKDIESSDIEIIGQESIFSDLVVTYTKI